LQGPCKFTKEVENGPVLAISNDEYLVSVTAVGRTGSIGRASEECKRRKLEKIQAGFERGAVLATRHGGETIASPIHASVLLGGSSKQ
jgi:hypothetical protein